MTGRLQAPKGTFDILPEQDALREHVLGHARELLSAAGYARLETPHFEETELFARGVGASTDIVKKEMFTFEDLGGRSMTLRPEGTAGVSRAFIEHGMHKDPQPVKLWYAGPYFRYEAPQKGRFRQFNQIGAEVIGTDNPLADAELILLLDELLRGLGIDDIELRLGSLGSVEGRRAYRDELRAYLHSHEAELSDDVRDRIDENPMRAFDSDHEGTRAVMATAPTMLERLDGEDAEHFESVQRMLDSADVPYRLDPTLVRGLDYYTRTVFEFTCDRLGAQSALGGGGRYDGLIAELGGPETPAIGWAAGIERILLAVREAPERPGPAAFVISSDSEAAFRLVNDLRRHRISAQLDLAGRAFKGQMKQADRSRAAFAVILEEDGTIKVRDMTTGEQREVAREDLPAALCEPDEGAEPTAEREPTREVAVPDGDPGSLA
jgi:histidyl-tRNA synthetase